MQPEPPILPTTPESTTIHTQILPNSNHGLQFHGAETSPLSSEDDTSRTAEPAERLASDAAPTASLLGSSHQPSPSRRLSAASTSSPPGGRRIAQYEQAMTTPPRRDEKIKFQVIHTYRSPSDKSSPIQDLPNEVLTHMLAHLAPTDLASVSLVSKRFHDLVTGPHAWRSAFARFFPGPQSLSTSRTANDDDAQDLRSTRRAFTRLTALASWRSEYILRTRLLRSLYRGKPLQGASNTSSPRAVHSTSSAPTIAYNSSLFTTINHLHATFGDVASKRFPRFIHGADETGNATSSEPSAARVDNWGLSDPQVFLQFADRFPGDAEYGLGPGEIIGAPNVMDVSQLYGMIHGEGSPGGMTYYRSTEELRGRFLAFSSAMSVPDIGIPRIASSTEAVTAVWIAKSSAIPDLTEGLIGILSASSLGVLTAYSLGATSGPSSRSHRFSRGEMTARWVLSPGVPIVAIAVDNEYSLKRQAQNRIWAVALNALGEVFHLTKFPKRAHIDKGVRLDEQSLERHAWLTGRTVYWNLAEPSRRVAKPDPYANSMIDGSYSPRTSWNGMCLNKDQIQAETREIEAFTARKPKDFQRSCVGWDMRRKIEVDFAGDDGNNAGENVVVLECGHEDGTTARIVRYTRCRTQQRTNIVPSSPPSLTSGNTEPASPHSLFGAPVSSSSATREDLTIDRLADSLSQEEFSGSLTPRPASEDWYTSTFALNGLKQVQINTCALDCSYYATITTSEDPLLSFSGKSTSSSPSLTPTSPTSLQAVHPNDIPGQRARLLAVGTKTGIVTVWNIRSPTSSSVDSTNSIDPIRIINTDSPEISSLALTSLYLVHGGNDGLVQAWDPLMSNMQPIRTLNSKFISRARRRLVQAQASPQGVGINLFAAGAICLDPDPTVLRGMVSLGLQLLYWSFSSSAADQYKSQKRRLRRSERGSNNGGERFSGAPRSNLKDYIASERYELDREKKERKKAADRFAGRFGTELLGGSEEEMLAYAAMLSQESLEQEDRRRVSDTSTAVSTAVSSSDPTPARSPSPPSSIPKTDDELDADIAEAIRQSLASTPSRTEWDIPIRQMRTKGRKGSSAKASPRFSPSLAGSSKVGELSDLDFALQISLAEEQSKVVEGDNVVDLGGAGDNDATGKEKRSI